MVKSVSEQESENLVTHFPSSSIPCKMAFLNSRGIDDKWPLNLKNGKTIKILLFQL